MTVTINLPPEREATFQAQARARGLSIEDWLLQLAEEASDITAPAGANLVDVCAMVRGLADDLELSRNRSRGRSVDL